MALIRRSASPGEAKSGLMVAFALSAIQAQAILDMRLQRLTGLEREKIIEEYASVLMDIERFKAILASDQLVLEIIKTELDELQTEFGDRRRTQIVPTADEITMEDMIAEEDMVVTVTGAGYIKRTPLSLYQSQRRGGQGQDRDDHQGRGLRTPAFRRLDPPYLPFLYQPGQGLLAQGLRNSPVRAHQRGQEHRQPARTGGE